MSDLPLETSVASQVNITSESPRRASPLATDFPVIASDISQNEDFAGKIPES